MRKIEKDMNLRLLILTLFILITSCRDNLKEKRSEDERIISDMISSFETELNNLKNDEIVSIDLATNLFKKYALKTNNINQKDSLFQPYFNFYILGQNLLKDESEETILKYGFKKIRKDEIEYLLPSQSKYLESNVIKYLSEPMQEFCQQQLKEFHDSEDLQTIVNNTLWWERFNERNQNFFLIEMTKYHYKNWHLKNLISGTNTVKVFTEEEMLSEQAKRAYQKILENHPNTKTADLISEYLDLLEKSKMKKTEDINQFIEKYE